MNEYIIEQFYGDTVKVHLFAHDVDEKDIAPREFVRHAKFLPSEVRSGELLDSISPGEVYHVPTTNSIYFSSNFTDFEIVGTVDGPDCLEVYCDFYAAFRPEEVAEMLTSEGWLLS